MKTWTKILPFFFIEWFAKRYLMVEKLDDHVVTSPYGGVWIFADGDWETYCKFLNRRPASGEQVARERIRNLEALVEESYREGWHDGREEPDNKDFPWGVSDCYRCSDTKAALENLE